MSDKTAEAAFALSKRQIKQEIAEIINMVEACTDQHVLQEMYDTLAESNEHIHSAITAAAHKFLTEHRLQTL